jgi:hypothetical protein
MVLHFEAIVFEKKKTFGVGSFLLEIHWKLAYLQWVPKVSVRLRGSAGKTRFSKRSQK